MSFRTVESCGTYGSLAHDIAGSPVPSTMLDGLAAWTFKAPMLSWPK